MNPISNLTTSFLLLAIGLTVLWLAATNRLGNFANAWKQLGAVPVGNDATSNLQSSLSQSMGGPATTNVQAPVTIPGVGTINFPVPLPTGTIGTPPIADPNQPITPSGAQLEVGGGTTYHLPQLPSLGTIVQH
jgi:hypothetical protein